MSVTELYELQASGLGKFEGEASYVPYFWDHIQYAEDDDGDVLTFRVTHQDILLFPDLEGRKTVRLRLTDSGFVCEV